MAAVFARLTVHLMSAVVNNCFRVARALSAEFISLLFITLSFAIFTELMMGAAVLVHLNSNNALAI